MNDDRNVRVLFERALKVLPPDESVEVMFHPELFSKGSDVFLLP